MTPAKTSTYPQDSIEHLSKLCHGQLHAVHPQTIIKSLVADSRRISRPADALFVALMTNHRDGHQYIAEAYTKGVRSFLVQTVPHIPDYPEANFIAVKDTLAALHQIVAARRQQYLIPVIGITGSNGKTIVKEWLYQLLHESYVAVRSPKSFNSQLGVPLSVWMLNDKHRLGIFEAGISQPGEMEKLERIIHPNIGIFTNIGEAHSEGFMNVRQKINEKLMLFRHAKQLIYCKDYPELNESIVQYMNVLKGSDSVSPIELFTWSQKSDATLRVININKVKQQSAITALYKDEELSITIPFADPAYIENAIHCWCAMLLLGVPHADIQARMQELHAVSMRLELRHGINDCTIINDSYNSDLTSLLIALNYLEQQQQHKQHTVILSDMLQIGKPDSELYEEVATLISQRSIQRFIGIGPALYKHKQAFRQHKKLRSIFFKSTEEFLKKFHLLTFQNEAVLLKGARAFTFEKIGMLLEQKIHQTVLSINLSSLTHNLNTFRTQLKPGVKVMAMVKAFAYGSGSYEIANLLQFAGVDYLSVAYTDEGVELRKAGITLPIMVMSPDESSFDRMIAWKLEPEIFNMRSLHSFIAMAQTLQVAAYPIHIKLDTGMHRLGFVAGELQELGSQLQAAPQVKVASIFSHLAASEDPTLDHFTETQGQQFDVMSKELIAELGYRPLCHLCNSAAIARHPQLHYDMVRLGLGLYGIDGSGKLQKGLQQISTLKTTIAQIKEVPEGDTIGYGRKGHADKPMRIATISIGYADGYPRALGNGTGHVLIHGQQAPIAGVVCMDMCMVDISHIPETTEGDEAIIFSPALPLTQLAQWASTIPYEIMTGISQRVKRVYENEG